MYRINRENVQDDQKNKSDRLIFLSKNQPGLQRSDPLKSSLSSHSLLVSDSVCTTSSCCLLAFSFWSTSRRRVYVASVSRYPFRNS